MGIVSVRLLGVCEYGDDGIARPPPRASPALAELASDCYSPLPRAVDCSPVDFYTPESYPQESYPPG